MDFLPSFPMGRSRRKAADGSSTPQSRKNPAQRGFCVAPEAFAYGSTVSPFRVRPVDRLRAQLSLRAPLANRSVLKSIRFSLQFVS